MCFEDVEVAAVRKELRRRPPEMSGREEMVVVRVEVGSEKKAKLPSRVETASCFESGRMARERIVDWRGRGSLVCVRLKMDQRRRVWSQLPLTRVSPEGVKERVEIGPSWPES